MQMDRTPATWTRLTSLRRIAVAIVAVLVLSPEVGRAAGCDKFADYADELVPSNFQLISETPLPGGLAEVELSFQVANIDIGDFASASATLDLAGAGAALGIEEVTQPAAFDALVPLAVENPTTNLRLSLPAANVSALLADLASGGLPLTMHAAEQDILAPGVQILSWSSSEDAYYAIARDTSSPPVNLDPGPPPYTAGAEFGIVLVALFDGASSTLDNFDTSDTFYIIPDAYVPTEIPEAMHYARVLDVSKSDEDGTGPDASDGITTWFVSLKRTDTELLPDLYTSASFCTGTTTHIDLPVQATRLHTIDGETQEEADRDGRPQPIHLNELGIAGVATLSGQLEGHVLRPSLELRLRAGSVRAVVDIDTDLSLTAELRAQVTDSFQEDIDLIDLCFPLPDLIAGPIPIGMNLQLEHGIGASGNFSAGAIVGFQKSFEGGFTVGYDGRLDPADRHFSRSRHGQPNPVEFTPPQLLDDTGVELTVSTEIRTTLRVGAQYPLCDTGFGAYLGARAHGSLDVFPTQDPWWRLGHGAEVFAGINLELLGLEVTNQDWPAELFAGEESLDAGGPITLGGPVAPTSAAFTAGEDQRWGFAIDTVGVPNGVRRSDVATLSDGRVIVMAEEKIGGRDRLIGLDPFGALLWSVEYAGLRSPRRITVLPDDSIIVAGEPAWMAHHDANGAILASWDFTVTDVPTNPLYCVVRSGVPIEDSPGVWGFVAVGHHARTDVRERDACAFRADAAGNLVWARTYGDAGAQDFWDVMVASDGRVIAVGEAELGPTAFSTANALFASLDEADGSLIWSRNLPSISRNMRFNAVAEAPDGTIFGAGGGLRSIGYTGAAMVARIDPDGENAHHGLILQDEIWEGLIPESAFVDTAGGDTAYDEIFGLTRVSGGFLFAGATGLGADRAGWVGKINDGLGIEWFRTFDGDEADVLDGVHATSDGYLVSGFSSSLDRNLPETDPQLWLMKLAFEGGASLRTDAGLTTRYIAPGVRASSSDADFVPDGIVSQVVPLTEVDALADSTVASIATLLDPTPELCLSRLSESGRESELDACEPVPEPSVPLLLVSGALALVGFSRKRRR